MFTFSKPLDQITEADLQRLVEDHVEENRQLEYKRELPGTGGEEKKEYVRDVVSFANSAGGHIIFGIAESNGMPTELAAISEDKIDDAKLRLENIIRTSVEPTIQGLKIDSVRLASGRALIIEIPRGLFGLHMIKNRGAFIGRTSSGKFELDVNEIRAAFVGAEAAVKRLSEFRADRTTKILNGDALWPLSSTRVFASHLLPLVSFSSSYVCSVDKLSEEVKNLLYPPGRYPWSIAPKFTFEGFANLVRSGGAGQAMDAYSQIFRNGAIESVNATLLETSEKSALSLNWLEIQTMDWAERMLKVMDLLEIPGPYYLLFALLNVKGVRVIAGPNRTDPRTIDRANLIVPEVLLENSAISMEREMRDSFDMLWNACGWQRSFSYDEGGSFITDRRSAMSSGRPN
jgi:hypothetical protein